MPETLTDAMLRECLAALDANNISVVNDPVDEIVQYAASRKWTGLTHDAEIALAKRIEAHAHAVVGGIVTSSLLLAKLSTLGDQLRAGTIEVADLLVDSADLDDVCSRIQNACTLGRGLDKEPDANVLEARRRQISEELVSFRFIDPVVDGFKNALRAERSNILRELEEAEQIASDASNELVQANHMQVVSSAKRHAGHGVPFAELLEAGDLALRKAVDHYDYRRGYKFSTYARWWIHNALVGRIAARAGGAG